MSSVYERLNSIRTLLLNARRFEALGPETPGVLDSARSAITEAASIARGLPTAFISDRHELPWDLLWAVEERSTGQPMAAGELRAALDGLAPFEDAVFIVVSGSWSGDAFTEARPSPFFTVNDGRTDYSFAQHEYSRAGVADLVIPGVGNHRCLMLSALGIWVQLSDSAARDLAGPAGMQSWARRLGIGRVRKDHSTPLEPPGDQVWVQSVFGDATLVCRHERSETGYAYFKLGQLSMDVKSLATTFSRVPVMVCVSDDFLPSALMSAQAVLIEEKRAWGALIATTANG